MGSATASGPTVQTNQGAVMGEGRTDTPTDRPATWDLMRGNRDSSEIHPYWTQVVTASGVTLLGGVLLSLVTLPWWGWTLVFVGLFASGAVLGSAVSSTGTMTENWFGTWSGAVWFVSVGVLGLFMHAADFHSNPFAPGSRAAWLIWLGIAVVGGVIHRWIWGRIAELGSSKHPRAVAWREKRNGSVWERAFKAVGLGNITIEHVAERWSGTEVTFRTDPDQATSYSQLQGKADALVDVAHKALRSEGEKHGLGLGEAEMLSLNERDLFKLRVRTRDPLAETITAGIPQRGEFPVTDNATQIHLGYWETGDELSVPAAGPHTFAVGTTGSGKSTFLIALQVGYARRTHWTIWAAGTSKFADLVQPLIDAAATVGGSPIVEMWGGGDSGATGELYAAQRMVTAAYVLYLDRARRAGNRELTGRQGRDFVGSDDCPWIALFLDEFDNLVKRSGDTKIKLPTGDAMSVWDMLVDLGSKARSYGIELIYATQRTTNTWAGGQRSMNDILTLCNTRFVFRTSSGSSIQDILKDQQAAQKARKLEQMSFACMASVANGDTGEYSYGKVALWEDDDLVEITRLANELGTLTTLGDADKAALGELYVQGPQPALAPNKGAGNSTATAAADPDKWGSSNRAERQAQLTDQLLQQTGHESGTYHDQAPDTPEGAEPDPAESDPFSTTLEEIEQIPTLTQDEVDALRGQHDNRYPDTPEELLGALLDAWDDLTPRPSELTAADMVRTFELHWLDVSRDSRDSDDDVVNAASGKLGVLLQTEPISVQPRRTNRGKVYAHDALMEAYHRIMGNNEAE